MISSTEATMTASAFDQRFASLDGLPDCSRTKATTLRTVTPIRQLPETWIVQTIRQRDCGDTVFLEYVGPDGTMRIAIPPSVSDTIIRQRDALSSSNRRKAARATGRAQAEARKAAGLPPAFMKRKRTK